MTDPDHTGQTATDSDHPRAETPAGDQPPARPSPYLDSGEKVPQAYLAPPQPGQPAYGSPRMSGQRVLGRQPSRPAPGQPPAPGRRPGRDPALATPWERLAACVMDWAIIFTVSVLAFLAPLLRVWREYKAVFVRYPSLNGPGAQAAVDAIARDPANQRALLYWFLGIFAIALVYYWAQHAAFGATLGKRALGTVVVSATDRSRVGAGAAGLRAVAFLAGPAVFLLLPAPLNAIGGLLWLADTIAPLVDSRTQCLHDKLTGTIVINQRRLRSQARSPWPGS